MKSMKKNLSMAKTKDWTDKELDELEGFAELLFSNDQLAQICETKTSTIIAEISLETPAGRRIIKGRLKTEASLRDAQIKMALNGSQPAANECFQLLKQMKL